MRHLNLKYIISSLSFVYFQYILYCDSAQCGQLTTSDDCNKNPSFDWSDLATPPCFCAADAPLDIMFMIDESNSMKLAGFSKARNYTADMIRDGVSESSNIHIGKFSKSMKWAYQYCDDQSDKAVIEQAARNTPYQNQGNTRMC